MRKQHPLGRGAEWKNGNEQNMLEYMRSLLKVSFLISPQSRKD